MEQQKREQIYIELLRGVSRVNRILWGEVALFLSLDITQAQREALFVIAEAPKTFISDIATRLGITNGAVSQLVDSLEKIKVVQRVHDESDSRRVWVRITAFGESKLQELGEAYIKKFNDVFESVSLDDLKSMLVAQQAILAYGEANKSDRIIRK